MEANTLKSFYTHLFNYNQNINIKIIESFVKNNAQLPQKSVALFSHVLNAHHIWNNRIFGKKSSFNVWEIHEIQNFKTINNKNYITSQKIINILNLNETIIYSNSKNQSFTKSIHQILFHIINHSTYHKGQIATLFRQNNIEPIISDYIFYN